MTQILLYRATSNAVFDQIIYNTENGKMTLLFDYLEISRCGI